MGVRKRKLENDLITLGACIIAFAVWSFIKASLNYLFLDDIIDNSLPTWANILVVIIAILFVAADAALRVYVGLAARSEGFGKRRSIAYLIWVMILSTGYTIAIVGDVVLLISMFEGLMTTIVSLLIDATSLWFLIRLFCASLTLRQLRKEDSRER